MPGGRTLFLSRKHVFYFFFPKTSSVCLCVCVCDRIFTFCQRNISCFGLFFSLLYLRSKETNQMPYSGQHCIGPKLGSSNSISFSHGDSRDQLFETSPVLAGSWNERPVLWLRPSIPVWKVGILSIRQNTCPRVNFLIHFWFYNMQVVTCRNRVQV